MVNQTKARSKKYSMELDVTMSGMTISVAEGDVVMEGVSGTVPAIDHEVTSDPTHRVSVYGYLVEETETGDLDVLVDEVSIAAGDELYFFDGSGPYRLLNHLFHAAVPAGTTDLADVDVTVYSIEKVEEPEPTQQMPPEREPVTPSAEPEEEMDPQYVAGGRALFPDGGE